MKILLLHIFGIDFIAFHCLKGFLALENFIKHKALTYEECLTSKKKKINLK